MSTANTVIVNQEGKFLVSCSLLPGPVSAKWSDEYPDAKLFASRDTYRVVADLNASGIECEAVENYGYEQ